MVFKVGDIVEVYEDYNLVGPYGECVITDIDGMLYEVTYPCGAITSLLACYMLVPLAISSISTLTRPYDNHRVDSESGVEVENYVDFTNINIRDTI